MKRLFVLLLVLALILSGCGQKAQTPPAPAATPVPSPTAEPSSVTWKADGKMFAMTMEYGRLYLLPIEGGEAVLLSDKNTNCFDRGGNTLYAAFDDGSVTRYDLSAGESVTVVEPGGPNLSRIYCWDGGFVGEVFTMSESTTYIYREADGSLTKETRFGEFISPVVAGNKLAYILYENDANRLVVWDLNTMTQVWKTTAPQSSILYGFGDQIYLYDQENGLRRVAADAEALEGVKPLLGRTDYTLGYMWDGHILVEGNYYNGNVYNIVSDNGRQIVEQPPQLYLTYTDAVDNHVLLQAWEYFQSEKVDSWYYIESFFALDMATGELTKLEARGKYSPLFAGGDFPVMDSSTARKPVTADIYSFFCEGTGYGGAVPLCSTTHNAWLNIADGVADIALLAAPTREEQEYLKARNVSVEMKLYGGDGLVFIGNRACGVEDLTLDQVRGIFRGEITNWAQLGGVDHPIRVLYRDDQSGSQRLFERLLWAGMEVPDLEALGFERLDEMSTIVSECLYDPYSIGYSIMTYLNDVYGKEDLLCFSLEGQQATPENVAAKLYPLSTQGYVVIRSDEPADSGARRLFDWFGSPLCDRILTNNGVTPLHD